MRRLACLKRENGAVMVEFALVSTILILLLVGIIDYGLLFNTQLMMENAARDGARYAALPGNTNDSDVRTTVLKSIPNLVSLGLTGSNITISRASQRGQPTTVTINFTYRIPVTLGVLPQDYNLEASAVMMQE